MLQSKQVQCRHSGIQTLWDLSADKLKVQMMNRLNITWFGLKIKLRFKLYRSNFLAR